MPDMHPEQPHIAHRTRAALLGAVVAGLFVSAPVFAQDEDWERERDRFLRPESQVGTRFKQSPETAEESDARQMQKRIAKCVFYRNKDDVRALLVNSDFDRIDFDAIESDPDTLFDDLDFGDCLGRAMKHSQYKIYATMRYSTLRNLLAEEAYLKDNDEASKLSEGAPKVLTSRFAFENGGPRAEVLAELSDCITYRNLPAADAVLRERPGTDDELEALDALGTTLVTCLDTEDPPEFSASMVRQLIADGLWARSHYGQVPDSEVGE